MAAIIANTALDTRTEKDPDTVDIGLRLRKAREDAGLSINDVARHFKWDRQTIGTWENGHANIPVKKLKDICDYYKVSSDWILTGKEPGGWEDVVRLMPERMRQASLILADRPSVLRMVTDMGQMSEAELESLAALMPNLSRLSVAQIGAVNAVMLSLGTLMGQVAATK